MKASLAYIDDVMDKEIESRHKGAASFTDEDHSKAKEAGTRSISGFPVFDEAKEKQYLDDLIASRRKLIDTFISDRKIMRDKLSRRGITPLAILPTDAWNAICDQTELFQLNPSPTGGVRIPYHGVSDWVVETSETKRNMFGGKFTAKSYDLRKGSAEAINYFARENKKEFLKKLFDGLVAHGGSDANVVLPTPPADVVAILIKAEGLSLKIAAEADAINFDKAPSEIVKSLVDKMEAEARIKERHDADPIVYCEEGTATAVIAQFGDFPVEKMVVDTVVKAGDLIKEKPSHVDYARYVSYPGHTHTTVAGGGGGGGGAGGLYITDSTSTHRLTLAQIYQDQMTQIAMQQQSSLNSNLSGLGNSPLFGR